MSDPVIPAYLNSLEYLFDEPDVIYFQHSQTQDNLPKDAGELEAAAGIPDTFGLRELGWSASRRIANPNSYIDRLLVTGTWAKILMAQECNEAGLFAVFSFTAATFDRLDDPTSLIESACLDMVGWLGSAGLVGCSPQTVRHNIQYASPATDTLISEMSDITEMALPVFTRLASVAGLV